MSRENLKKKIFLNSNRRSWLQLIGSYLEANYNSVTIVLHWYILTISACFKLCRFELYVNDKAMSSSSWHSQPVFVYGTLKRDQPNSFMLQTAIAKSQAKFLGQATTVDCWPLIVYTPFNVPYLLDSKGTGKASTFFTFQFFSSLSFARKMVCRIYKLAL